MSKLNSNRANASCTIKVRGDLPADIVEQISELHAVAILGARRLGDEEEAKADGLHHKPRSFDKIVKPPGMTT